MPKRIFVAHHVLKVHLFRTSVSVFSVAAALAMLEVISISWKSVPSGPSLIATLGFGLLGFVASAGYAVTTHPEGKWWRALAVGGILAIPSVALVPAASTLRRLSPRWYHKTDADRIASILAHSEFAPGSGSGSWCLGLDLSECDALADTLRSFRARYARGGTGRDGTYGEIIMRDDYYAVKCWTPNSCEYGWSFPAGTG